MKFLSNNGLQYLITKLMGVDFIVEEGTATAGDIDYTYRKWNSGIAECWGYKPAASYAMTSTYGNGYFYNVSDVPFPSGLFTSSYSPNIKITTLSGSGLVFPSLRAQSASAFSFYMTSMKSETLSVGLEIYAIGRWK